MTTPLITYLGKPDLKAAFLGEITKHEQADALIKGSYGRMNGHFRGCAIGCSLYSLSVLQGKAPKDAAKATGDHRRYEAELGLPTWFAYMEDNIFENLPDALAKTWPRRLAEAIPVGAVVDDAVLAKILLWTLTDAEFGVRYATDKEDTRSWIDAVAAYIKADSDGEASADQREAAAWDAWDARAARAAWDARDARAARAAWDAWDAWDARDARAARAAWAAWDAWDARDARAARAAWAAWDAWAARDAWDARAARDASINAGPGAPVAARKADRYFPALSEYVLTLVRSLPVK